MSAAVPLLRRETLSYIRAHAITTIFRDEPQPVQEICSAEIAFSENDISVRRKAVTGNAAASPAPRRSRRLIMEPKTAITGTKSFKKMDF